MKPKYIRLVTRDGVSETIPYSGEGYVHIRTIFPDIKASYCEGDLPTLHMPEQRRYERTNQFFNCPILGHNNIPIYKETK